MLVDAETVTRMVGPYCWLLERVGAEGIELTGAEITPALQVEAAIAELEVDKEWIGKANREVQTTPVLHLREIGDEDGPAAQAPRNCDGHLPRAQPCATTGRTLVAASGTDAV